MHHFLRLFSRKILKIIRKFWKIIEKSEIPSEEALLKASGGDKEKAKLMKKTLPMMFQLQQLIWVYENQSFLHYIFYKNQSEDIF